MGELGKGRRDLEAHIEDLALALEANVGGPFDHAGEVTTGLDIGADSEVARFALDKGVLRIGR